MKKLVKIIGGLLLISFVISCTPLVGIDQEKIDNLIGEDGAVFKLLQSLNLGEDGYPVNGEEDSDGDGLTNEQEKNWGTNPFMADTDGDGFLDGEEALEMYVNTTGAFHPCIADLPKIAMELTSRPKIVLSYTHSTEKAKSESIEFGNETSKEESASSSYSYTAGLEHSWSVGIEAGVEDGKFTGKIALGYSGTSSTEDSWSYENGSSVSYVESLSKATEQSESEGYEYDGGKMLFAVRFTNSNDVAYTVTSLSLDAYRVDATKENFIIPIGKLVPQNGDGSFTIAPGESKETIYVLDDLTLEEIEEVLKYSNAITVRISDYTFSFSKDGNDTDFTGILTTSAAKTASVTIDYGPSAEIGGSKINNPTESYKVSTKTSLNADATDVKNLYKSITIEKLLSSSGLDTAMKIDEDKHITDIRGIKDTALSEWYIYHTTTDAYTKNTITQVYKASETPIDSIFIETQDSVDFIYSVDQDEDGIPLRVENMFGTSDENTDSDGDGLSDYDEIMGKVQNADSTFTTTNPASTDTDWDGYPDNEDEYPGVPAVSDDARIESISYRIKTAKESTSLYTADPDTTEKQREYTLPEATVAMDSVNFTVNTVIPGSIITCTLGSTSIKATSGVEFEVPGLALGSNKIVFEVTSTDLCHKATYTLDLESVLETPTLGTLKSDDKETNKKLSIKYTVNDKRITDVVLTKSSEELSTIANNPDLFRTNSDFAFSTPEYGKEVEVLIPYDKYNTQYEYKVFSIAGNGKFSDSVTAKVTTRNASKGIMTFGLHSVECVKSHDGGTDYDCEYYWTIKGQDITLSEKPEKQPVGLAGGHTYQVQNKKYYQFLQDTTSMENLALTPANCKAQTYSYSKSENATFNLYIKIIEDDNVGGDDTIFNGYVGINYDAATDTWTLDDKKVTNNSTVWFEKDMVKDNEELKLHWYIKWEDDNSSN